MPLVLRPDQEGPVQEVSALMRQGVKRVLLQGATGWGKGSVAAHCLASAARRGVKSVFVCHREEINGDLARRLQDAGAPSVRLIGDRETEGDGDAMVTVASIQVVDARSLEFEGMGLMWIDECHRAAANSYLEAGARHASAYHVGSTATPARSDGRPLNFYQAIVQGPQIQWLVSQDLLAPVRLLAPDAAMDTLADDPVERFPSGVQGIVFGHSVEHSRLIEQGLLARGIKAVHVDGSTRGRDNLIRDFNSGSVQALTSYRLLTEGVDTRAAKYVGLATKMLSVVAFLQSIGRGRRPTGALCTVDDMMGSFHIHGHPDALREYMVDGPAGIVPVSEGPITRAVQCKGCLAWSLPAARCSLCGFRLPPPKPPRITKKEMRERRLVATPKQGAGWDLWSSLVQTSRQRRWKPQAAAMQFKNTTGQWPKWTAESVPSDESGEGGGNAA